MSTFTHGTAHAYLNRGCRCDECREANREIKARMKANARRDFAAGLVVAPHGTDTTYRYFGCRCPGCTAAARTVRESACLDLSADDPRHGKRATYVGGCRCDRCRAADRAYQAEYRRRKAAS